MPDNQYKLQDNFFFKIVLLENQIVELCLLFYYKLFGINRIVSNSLNFIVLIIAIIKLKI